MRAKNTFVALSAVCMSLACATTVVAQDDLDSLLGDAPAPAKKAAPAKPAEPAPVVAEEAKAEKPAVAEEKPAEAAPAAVETKAEEKPVVAAQEAEEKPAAAEEKKPVTLDTLVENSTGKKEAPAKVEVSEDDKLISDLSATEALSRRAQQQQAMHEIAAARKAMEASDYEEAYRQYSLASSHLNERLTPHEVKRECKTGMAEAKFQLAKLHLRDGDREGGLALAKDALTLRHPKAQALIESIEEEGTEEVEKDIADIKHVRNEAAYKEDRDTIRRRLRLSAQYLAVSDLNKALEQCELVLRYDQYNQQAISLRERIQRRREIIIEKEREATRKGMIADVGAAWRPVYAVNSAELKETEGGTIKNALGDDSERSVEQTIESRMKAMILPTIAFRPPATIIDAVDYFRQASKDYDKPEIPMDQRGFNFVLQLGKQLTAAGEEAPAAEGNAGGFGAQAEEAAEGPAGVPQIPNISASNVSLWEALKLVCKISGFKFKVQGSVVMVMPKEMTTDELVTRSYNVVESFLDQMNDATSALGEQEAGAFGGGNSDDDEGSSETANQEQNWKNFFSLLGVDWPQNSRISYIKAIGKLRVTNTAEQLAVFEQALHELNIIPRMVEIETRFVEVAQEDLNSLGFEWLLNSDYSLNVGGKLGKVLGLKNGVWDATQSAAGYNQTAGTRTDTTSSSSSLQNSASSGSAENFFGGASTGTSLSSSSSSTSSSSSGNTSSRTDTYTWSDAMSAGRNWTRGSSNRRNVGVSAVNGTDYSTGMRYLSTDGNHISGKGNSTNDKFMRVNAFLGNADLSMILHMLSQRSDTDLLSAPKVLTKPTQEAVMKVVTIYRYPQDYDVTIQSTSSGSSSSVSGTSTGGSDGKILPMVEPQNFETQEVGVILTVTPESITENGMINLHLTPKVISEPTWKDYGMKVPMASVMSSTAQTTAMLSGNEDMQWFSVPMEQPFFKERSIDTNISIYDGATIVMGGLITEERKSMEDKIPFLGDLPFIGRLFRSRSEWSSKRNLLIFVTARLVDPRGQQMQRSQDSDATATDANVTPAPED